MKSSRALWGLGALTVCYVGTLLYIDGRNRVFDIVPTMAPALAVAASISLISFSVRYGRWHWLLLRRGFSPPPVASYLGYFAGFAYTATPGKVGELARIRYFSAMGIPREQVVACFIVERTSDLLAVLLLALTLTNISELSAPALILAAVAIACVYALVHYSAVWRIAAVLLRRMRLRRAAKTAHIIERGLSITATYFNVLEVLASVMISLAAWTLQSLGFLYLLYVLKLSIPLFSIIGLYSLASLIGAASLIPGGLGATEVATTVLLAQFGAPLELAIVAAIAMRLSTIWLATVLGFAAIALLESSIARRYLR